MTDTGNCSYGSLGREDVQDYHDDFRPTSIDSSPWNTIIRPVLDEMCKVMSPRELATKLYSKRLLSSDQLHSLRQMPETDAAIQLLTDILPRKGPQAYDKFVSVIEQTEGQDFLVEQFRLRHPGAYTSVLQPAP